MPKPLIQLPAIEVLICAPVSLVVCGMRHLRTPLDRALAPAGKRRLGFCAACGDSVFDGDAFLRYRGEYYHAGPCVELDPPALRTHVIS